MNISISVADMGALCDQIGNLEKSLKFQEKYNRENGIDNEKLRQENERLKNQEATYISKINSLQKADEHAANLIERGFRKEAELTKELEDREIYCIRGCKHGCDWERLGHFRNEKDAWEVYELLTKLADWIYEKDHPAIKEKLGNYGVDVIRFAGRDKYNFLRIPIENDLIRDEG